MSPAAKKLRALLRGRPRMMILTSTLTWVNFSSNGLFRNGSLAGIQRATRSFLWPMPSVQVMGRVMESYRRIFEPGGQEVEPSTAGAKRGRTMRRWLLVAVAAAVTLIAAGGQAPTRAAGSSCPAPTCLTQVLITDGAPDMGAPFLIEDNEGKPPGQNAVMAWVDGFQLGSVNPVCTIATAPYLAREACLGGPPFDATGGHPVLALSPDNGRSWVMLTPADVALVEAMRASGITPRDVRFLARWLHATGR